MTQKNTFKWLLIIQMVAALILRGQRDKMWILISTLQVIVYLTIYNVDFPANLSIYLNELRKIAEFQVVDTEMVIEWVGAQEWFAFSDDPEERLEQEKYKISGLSTSIIENMMPFFTIIAVCLLVIIVMLVLSRVKKLNYIMTKKLRKFKREMVWNGVIRSLTMAFMKSFVTFAIALKIIDWKYST